jgi:hypothetical protein
MGLFDNQPTDTGVQTSPFMEGLKVFFQTLAQSQRPNESMIGGGGNAFFGAKETAQKRTYKNEIYSTWKNAISQGMQIMEDPNLTPQDKRAKLNNLKIGTINELTPKTNDLPTVMKYGTAWDQFFNFKFDELSQQDLKNYDQALTAVRKANPGMPESEVRSNSDSISKGMGTKKGVADFNLLKDQNKNTEQEQKSVKAKEELKTKEYGSVVEQLIKKNPYNALSQEQIKLLYDYAGENIEKTGSWFDLSLDKYPTPTKEQYLDLVKKAAVNILKEKESVMSGLNQQSEPVQPPFQPPPEVPVQNQSVLAQNPQKVLKVGDIVKVKGKNIRVKSIKNNGTFDGDEV